MSAEVSHEVCVDTMTTVEDPNLFSGNDMRRRPVCAPSTEKVHSTRRDSHMPESKRSATKERKTSVRVDTRSRKPSHADAFGSEFSLFSTASPKPAQLPMREKNSSDNINEIFEK